MPVSVLSKWGNSLALRVPKEVTRHFKEGDHFDVISDADGLHFRKSRKIRKYTISDVLETVSPAENGEMDWGSPRGREIW